MNFYSLERMKQKSNGPDFIYQQSANDIKKADVTFRSLLVLF